MRLIARGVVTIDTGVGRRLQPLGPRSWRISAPREVVFDVIAAPYLNRTPRAMESKLRVLVRGTDLVLAEHFTPVAGRHVATTVETVKFDRPNRIDYSLRPVEIFPPTLFAPLLRRILTDLPNV